MLRAVLRLIAVVSILYAAVAAAGAHDVQALVASVLFVGLTGLAAARRRAGRVVAERRRVGDVVGCARWIRFNQWDYALMSMAEAGENEKLAALLRALEDKGGRPDEGSPKP